MSFPSTSPARAAAYLLALLPFALTSCNRYRFPQYSANYREYAYVTDGAANTVAVLDLVYLRQDRVLQVGHDPTGIAVNPVRNEVYAVNTGSDSVSVIDATDNKITATIGVHRQPYFIDVAADGKRAYVANSGSNTVSVFTPGSGVSSMDDWPCGTGLRFAISTMGSDDVVESAGAIEMEIESTKSNVPPDVESKRSFFRLAELAMLVSCLSTCSETSMFCGPSRNDDRSPASGLPWIVC